ncbi:MAG: hypothetical protein LUQ50_12505 [Methanospirillum sp.]|uniref:hypothetical protein n=1 Tax=Methanospirillum sp. TaxID=45200 RepID=UPI00236D272B|nr:hypothetical protein [Methanospirillum sp.]MDD1729879.1 hypothetical protein [Methanospirillum sp.]
MELVKDKLPAGPSGQPPDRNGTMGRDQKHPPEGRPMDKSSDNSHSPPGDLQSSRQSNVPATETKSPISPVTIIAALGITGASVVAMNRR